MTKASDHSVGIRFLILLIPLFAAAVFAAFGVLYPHQISNALHTLSRETPLANPTICIRGGTVYDDALLSDFSSIGTCTPARCYDTETADGTHIRLMAIDSEALPDILTLTDGRMPQTELECVIVALQPTACPFIGAAIRPYGEDGTALLAAESNAPCTLTVVGIGENTLSALAPISDADVSLLVYTVCDTAWYTETAETQLLLTDCTDDDPDTAAQALCREAADAQIAYLTAQAETQQAALLAAAQEADNAVLAQEIVVQNLENRLDTANVRVAELENGMMDAIAVLQAEQQQFVSDMEFNEYYALRQVDLIPRRDRAEEGYAKQEAVIAQIGQDLHTAYADRDVIAAEHAAAEEILTALHESAEASYAALEASYNQIAADTVPWRITEAEQEPGITALNAHAASSGETAWMLCAIAAAVYLILSIIVSAVSNRAAWSVSRAAVSAGLIAISAFLFSGYVLANAVFFYTFPALNGTVSGLTVTPMMLSAGLLLPLLLALFAALTTLFCCRIRQNNAAQKKV